MTPEEARQILDQFANPTAEHLEEVYLWWLVQSRIMGRPWRGDAEPTAEYIRASQRSERLAQLHTEAHLKKHTGQDWHEPQAEAEKLLEEIYQEAVTELQEHGLPDAWKNAQGN